MCIDKVIRVYTSLDESFFRMDRIRGGGDDRNVLLPIAGPAGLRILSCTPIDLPDDLGAALKAKVLAHGYFHRPRLPGRFAVLPPSTLIYR